MKVSGVSSFLGIELEIGRLKVVELVRQGEQLRIRRAFQIPLSLDPLTDSPELVGYEIRKSLVKEGVRARRCMICIPLKWLLTLQTVLPPLADADADSYLMLQAEREFPLSPENLSLSVSRYSTPEGESHAMIAAVPTQHLMLLQQVFKAARLRTLGFTIGMAALPQKTAENAISLLLGEETLDMMVTVEGKIALLRTIEDAIEIEEELRSVDAGSIARQIRITLGQLPPKVGNAIRTVRIFGSTERTEPLVDELRSSLDRMGMTVIRDEQEWTRQVTPITAFRSISWSALSTAVGNMWGRPFALVFYPPQTSHAKRMADLFSSRKTLWAGVAPLILLFLVGIVFFLQSRRLASLEAQWKAIEPKVAEVEAYQKQIKKFQPWFDDTIRSLEIMKTVSEAFPEEGTIWLKNLTIKEDSLVSFSGSSKSNRSWMAMRDQLQAAPNIADIQLIQQRGEIPVQFTLNFQWKPGKSNG